MTTSLGVIVFSAAILGTIGGVLWFVAWSMKRSERYGKATVTADEAAELLARAQAAQEAERDIETIQRDAAGSAVGRLRASKNFRQ